MTNIKKPASIIIAFACVLAAGAGCRSVEAPSGPEQPWAPPEEDRGPVTLPRPAVDLSKPLALSDLVATALRDNPSTRQAWETARAAAAAVGQADSTWYPQVNVSGTGTYDKQDFSITGTLPPGYTLDANQLNYGPSLKVTWLLLDLGGRSGTIDQAVQTLIAANFSFNQALQDLLLQVEKTYFNFYSSQSALEAAEADLKDAQASLEAAREKTKVGLGSRLDELQAESNYYNSLYNVEAAKGNVQTSRADLAQAIGLAADSEFSIVDPAGEPPTTLSQQDVKEIIAEGLRNRPDLAALRASARASEAAVTAADSDLWPSLNLGGTANTLWYRHYGDEEDLYDRSNGYTGYLALSWDIFSGFYHLNRKRGAEAQAAVDREKLAAAELAASAEVWTKYYAFQTAVGKHAASQAYLASSQASYDLALESYQAGLKSILDLLQAQSALSSARSRMVTATRDVFVSLADLAHATGKLTVPAPAIPEDTGMTTAEGR